MSDNHARLFASAVPGNRSSDTIGENGNGHEGETDVTQETRDVGRYTPDQSDNGQRGTSPVGQTGDVDHGEPNEIEQECIEQMEDIRTAAHSPKGDKAHPRHCVEDERPSNAVRHIPIGWGDERGVTRH